MKTSWGDEGCVAMTDMPPRQNERQTVHVIALAAAALFAVMLALNAICS